MKVFTSALSLLLVQFVAAQEPTYSPTVVETYAPTSSAEDTTAVPTEGEYTAVPTEGEDITAVPTEGEDVTAVPTEGEYTAVPTEGEYTAVPTEGEAAEITYAPTEVLDGDASNVTETESTVMDETTTTVVETTTTTATEADVITTTTPSEEEVTTNSTEEEDEEEYYDDDEEMSMSPEYTVAAPVQEELGNSAALRGAATLILGLGCVAYYLA